MPTTRTRSTTSCGASATCRPTRSGATDGRRPARGLAPPRGAGRVAAGGPRADRRRGALDRDGGRRALPGRRRRRHPARRARRRSSAPAVGALDGLLARYARTHGPFLGVEPARRWGLPAGVVEDALHRLVAAGSLLSRRVPPGRRRARVLRSRGPAAAPAPVAGQAPREVEPVDPITLARFLPAWQGVAPSPSAGSAVPAPLRGPNALERLAEVVDQLAGLPIPASVLERDVLPARVPGYQPRLLDELGAMGEVAWVGRGSLGRDDGRVVLFRPGRELLRPTGLPDGVERPSDEIHERVRGSTCDGAAPRSTASCSRRRAGGRTARCSTRCGTSSGRAR